MLAMLQDLVHHKWYADARLLAAVQSNEAAANDQETRELLHHIMVSNRFWLATEYIPPVSSQTTDGQTNWGTDVFEVDGRS